jgi:hypothetical protein
VIKESELDPAASGGWAYGEPPLFAWDFGEDRLFGPGFVALIEAEMRQAQAA